VTTGVTQASGVTAVPGAAGTGGSGITALTGDVTASGSGSVAASVIQVNGAVVPTSAAYLASNSSKQLIAATAPVTSITFGTGLTGGVVTTTGTVAIDPTQSVPYSVAQNISAVIAANTSGDGLLLKTPTAAAAASQQYSPRLHLQGQGWATTPAASQLVDWIFEVVPVQGAANPTSALNISSATNGGAYFASISVASGANGVTSFGGPITASGYRVTGATIVANGTYLPATNTLGFSTNGVARGSFDANGNFITLFARADQSKSVQVPTTGFSITIGNNTTSLCLNPAGTLATGTITMPATPIDGQQIRISSTQTVTGLTLSPNTSQTIGGTAPITLTAGPLGTLRYIYHLAGTVWLPN